MLKWVCTKDQEADAPSREITPIFSRLKTPFSNRLVNILGIEMDLFASFENRLPGCQFYSEFYHPKAQGVDGMSYVDQNSLRCYAYPPRVLVSPFVKVRHNSLNNHRNRIILNKF